MRRIISPLDGIRSPFGRRSGAVAFSPAALFAASEQGGWYDPSDLTTLFQDSAGTTPVTAVEQPVGLVLDKSKGLVLGNELVTNGDFSSATGWSVSGAGVSITGGQLVFNAAGATQYASQSITTVGKTYKVTYTVSGYSAGSVRIALGGTFGPSRSANGTYTEYLQATANTIFYIITNGIPCTLNVEDVSLKELPGAHASQSTAASRPVLSARYNLLTYTEQFDNAAWSKFRSAITANQTTAPDGTNTADLFSINSTANSAGVQGVFSTLGAVARTGTVCLKAGTWQYVNVVVTDTSNDQAWAVATVDLNAGTITKVSNGVAASRVSTSIAAAGNGFYRVTVTATLAAGTAATLEISFAPSATPTFGTYGRVNVTGTASDYVYIWGADLRVSNAGVGLPAYQRVGAATAGSSTAAGNADYDTTGFPLYLRADGTDDGMSTASIDFSSTDKMSVFAGARKLSDAAAAILCELTASTGSNAGSFYISAPNAAGTGEQYTTVARGSAALSAGQSSIATANTVPAPDTAVISALHDISGDSSVLRRNGTAYPAGTSDKGTGNFANAALYVGSRGGSSLRFNGHIYGLVVLGRAVTAAEISSMETWMNQRTKAF